MKHRKKNASINPIEATAVNSSALMKDGKSTGNVAADATNETAATNGATKDMRGVSEAKKEEIKNAIAIEESNKNDNGGQPLPETVLSADNNNNVMILTGKRKRKAVTTLSPFITQHRRVERKAAHTEEEFAQSWICAECKEAECMMQPDADALVICDGTCRRVFHWPCAGFTSVPDPELPFYCNDCTRKQHHCSICQQYGQDDEDVFCCNRKDCGLYFHESCLSMQNVDVQIREVESTYKSGGENAVTEIRRIFICPAHVCWTCTQTDEKQQEKDKNRQEDEDRQQEQAGQRTKVKRKSNGGPKKTSSFESKSERFLFHCIVCPISYHASCIAPTSRFHEIALLCHEHSQTYKLPELDTESSFQKMIELKVDEKYCNLEIQRQNKIAAKGQNSFLPGLFGDRLSKREEKLDEILQTEYAAQSASREAVIDPREIMSGFCLPCDIQKEVEKQPPNFRQIYALKYDPNNRPPRALPRDVCHCVGHCGEDCLNRLLYVECFGDVSGGSGGGNGNAAAENGGGTNSNKIKNTATNCNVGPNCGNRQLGRRALKKCKPAREKGRGWGLQTLEKVCKGELVQEYIGEVIDEREKDRRLQEWTREHPNDPNFYIMALSPGWYIDARHMANLCRFVNHSCEPNCILHPINVNGHMRNGVFALRDISPGEFLSYDYHFDTKQGDRFICRCGSTHCRGTMKGGVKVEDGNALTKSQVWEEAKAQYERDKKYVTEYFEGEETRRSQVAVMVPAADKADELVANGVQQRHRPQVIARRVFLWRSAVRGSDFDSRLRRIQKRVIEK